MLLWEESNPEDIGDTVTSNVSTLKQIVDLKYKNKSQAFPPLQRNVYIWAFVHKFFHDIKLMPDEP